MNSTGKPSIRASGEARCLRLILGDQLNAAHSWFREVDPDVVYLIAELHQETDYVSHHVQKICAFFKAMENFGAALAEAGHRVHYLSLDDTKNTATLPELIRELSARFQVSCFEYQHPDEFRLLQQLQTLELPNVSVAAFDSEHFLLCMDELPAFFRSGTRHRMEAFYRKMRTRSAFLMEAGAPEGGEWNFDKLNRQRFKAADLDAIPDPLLFDNDVSEILDRLQRHAVISIGIAKDSSPWPATRQQCRQLLQDFCKNCLPRFGQFQDAMTGQKPNHWSLYHSRLGFAMNSKMISPREVIETAIEHYRNDDAVDIAQIEGFVRQILGWREFIRGIYWANMPAYTEKNGLGANRALPQFFWTGDTRMHCVSQTVQQSLEHAYAHHIQRLMITGNFSLLCGIDPDEVEAWYLGIYIDAIEWVESPNTRGMALHADGGLVGSKPYCAGGNYINKMSDYCTDCAYSVKERTGANACPFNSLYWNFLIKHREEMGSNPRMSLSYRSWDKINDVDQAAILSRAQWCIEHIEEL